MNPIPILYHFTCEHGHAGIEQSHVLRPNIHPFMAHLGPLLWLTDLAAPASRESVGLTSTRLSCDRMAYRYNVQCKAALHWYALRGLVSPVVVESVESHREPEHWWVVRRTVLPSEFAFDATWRNEVRV